MILLCQLQIRFYAKRFQTLSLKTKNTSLGTKMTNRPHPQNTSRFVRSGGFDEVNLRGHTSVQEAFPVLTRDGATNFGKSSLSSVFIPKKDRPIVNIDKQKLQTYMDAGKHLHAPTEEEYFNDDDEKDSEFYRLLNSQKPDATSSVTEQPSVVQDSLASEEDDPLDAFMADITVQAKRDADRVGNKSKTSVIGKDIGAVAAKDKGNDATGIVSDLKPVTVANYRADIEEEDLQESYFNYMEQNPQVNARNANPGSDEEGDHRQPDPHLIIDYDDNGNPIYSTERSKIIEPLPPVDHSLLAYVDFNKNFYAEHDDIKKLNASEAVELRRKLGLKTSGFEVPRPVCSFAHFGFNEKLMDVIRKSDYSRPTPIQAQAIPAALSGRDIIGIAKTGSGKTAAYLWPLILHALDQPELGSGDGPIALILAPTRELAQQIYFEAKRFSKPFSLTVACVFGGSNKHEQVKALRHGADICIATPGRMIDMVKLKATNLHRVTYLVLDEADRMFDMGFEPQVRSICNNIRPDRQTLLFSATFKRRIEKLARDALNDPVRIVQGELNEANEDVEQRVVVFSKAHEKLAWLLQMIVELTSVGSVLIFDTKKLNSDELAKQLNEHGHKCGLIHGDLEQMERNQVLQQFKRTEHGILVATDVAARGLDIPAIKTVVNYDVARDIETHIHRIGRTGRAGEKGTAYTLVSIEKDKEFAGHLVRNLESVGQPVSQQLLDLAVQSQWFRKSRQKNHYGGGSGTGGDGKRPSKVGGRGLGFSGAADSLFTSSSLSGTSVDDVIKAVKDEANRAALKAAVLAKQQGAIPGASPVASSGAQSTPLSASRALAMRSAMQARFKSNFARSIDQMQYLQQKPGGNKTEAGELINTLGAGSELLLPPQQKRVKKSRWE